MALALGAGAMSQQPTPSGSAQTWLANATRAALAQPTRAERELAASALALRALSLDPAPAQLDALRDSLFVAQRDDGAFGGSAQAGSAALTWLVLGALEASPRAADAQRASRARAWLATDGAAQGERAQSGTQASKPVSRALGFLHTANASPGLAVEGLSTTLGNLAGGPFDLRAAYASAMASTDEWSRIGATAPAGEWLQQPLYSLLLSVEVLDHYRTSREAALLAELSHPSADFERELAARRDAASGAFSREPGGRPELAATACALLIQDTLARWETARGPSAAPHADPRNSADAGRKALACEECHAALQPVQVEQWRASAHAGRQVGCADCHGTNHSTIFRESGKVAVAVCATCHAQAAAQFQDSKHAHAEQTLLASALFAATPPAARASCVACHRIGERQSDGSHGNCNYCHVAHTFDTREARQPEACTLCHTGADYPQDRAYRLSKHGALQQTGRDKRFAPTCATCHQPAGRHDDGFGITLGSSGNGSVLAGTPSAFALPEISAASFAQRRAEMVGVCTQCHSSRLAEASLRQADELKREGDAQLLEAATILRSLADDGYFGAGADLALGPEFARPDPARPGAALLERFYAMWRFEHASAWKGAYHQSASVANLASGAGTHDDLRFIRAEAERWRARSDPRGTQR